MHCCSGGRQGGAIPTLRASSPDRGHFSRTFAGMAQRIESGARMSKDAEFAGRCLDVILAWHGLTSTDKPS
ncbi:hypothetical protein VC279_15590 [Xanthomonas sp. WHRI 10064A]|uniref:hypothetical protein n=1 Tax=unclassified Xanthomonas TaxID=2643310 RepID=UPI002B2366C8|nr:MULTISPECIES: hypothetical protein [unclassified Xanthomonas]MEA9586886.1 hypothetical protein [Xanthomonas sp. WHRI 10064B]MEA9616077.1 hypothetical protein [Xanthomonas sp. WHRI 10064A]